MNKKEFFEVFSKSLPGQNVKDRDGNIKNFDIYFEHFSLDGIDEMYKYSKDARFYDHFESGPVKTIDGMKKQMESYLSRMAGDADTKVSHYWFIRKISDKSLVGTACLIDLNYSRRYIEWGYGINPQLWGLGYILQIQEILKDFAFNKLRLNRIHGTTMVTNKKTIESIRATGMQNEGIAREHYCKDGKFIDGWKYAMLKSDYEAQSQIKPFNKIIQAESVIDIVSSILSDVEIDINSGMENVSNWDSLNHMLIMVEIKDKLSIDLSPSDIADAVSIKEIMNIINSSKK